MSATIIFQNDGEETQIQCPAVLTLGRDKNSDIVIRDLLASRNHAMIRRLGFADYYLIDSGSSNGSYVNNQRVTMPRLLKNNDRLQIGGTELCFLQDGKKQDVVDTISMEETIIADTPVIRQLTVLVADIRGFTTLSEQVDIRTLTRIMNGWFHEVNEIIGQCGGIVDKFIGDCVFARWESEMNEAGVILQVLKAAYAINLVTEKLTDHFPEIAEKLRIGVGINTGVASMGIGTDNTALGDAVNIAFRLESATKLLGRDIVMSETAYRYLPADCLSGQKQHVRVKGKRDPLHICSMDFADVKSLLQKLTKKAG